MATVKINCPNCSGTGLIGTVQESVCPYCKGAGTIAANDTDTISTISAAATTAGYAPAIVTKPTPVPTAAVKVINRGK